MASTQSLKAEKLFSVDGYVCVVTGGGTGIGLMAAQALAANEWGLRPDVYRAGPCDVTSKEELDKLVQEISSKEKHINLLIANAGISGPKGIPEASDATELSNDLWKSESPPEWASVFDTNVTSVYFTTVAFLPLLQASQNDPARAPRSPSVIVISSMSGIMRNSQGHFAYNAAKGATVHLSKLMSAEFEKTNIRVNSIAPGYFPSEMTAKTSNEENKSDLPHEKVKEKGHVPAERPGSDEEMAMAMLFLCKNVYVNGEVIAVDGGVLNQMIMSILTSDPLDELFELENTFYNEGYDLGVQDGSRAGRIEGRLFGLEKGFEKYTALGKLHGRSVVWSGRLSRSDDLQHSGIITDQQVEASTIDSPAQVSSETPKPKHGEEETSSPKSSASLPQIPYNPRLEKHLRSLYALTEPASLSTDNSEDAVSEFDDRLKRAEGKVKIIEKLLGEESVGDDRSNASGVQRSIRSQTEDNGIEDMNVLHARH
ncbi:MAG: hypothetical protein Q9216_005208 [Gyalolechia sp. 2 TL-2023]